MLASRLLSTLALASVALTTSNAHADTSVEACADAYTKGQEERLAGRLSNARTLFQTCADPACPGAVVQDCQRWVAEVEADLPTAQVRVTDTAGRVPVGLSVFLDGHVVPLDALAKPLVMSPGPHVLRFEAPGYLPLELSPALRPEDRRLPVDALLRFAPATPPTGSTASEPIAPRDSSKGVPAATVTFAAIGAVALGGSIYFGISAKNRFDELKLECSPNCEQSKIDSVKSKALVSDIALAGSLVAFGAATYFYFSAKSDSPPTTALALEPTPRGATARLRFSF